MSSELQEFRKLQKLVENSEEKIKENKEKLYSLEKIVQEQKNLKYKLDREQFDNHILLFQSAYNKYKLNIDDNIDDNINNFNIKLFLNYYKNLRNIEEECYDIIRNSPELDNYSCGYLMQVVNRDISSKTSDIAKIIADFYCNI